MTQITTIIINTNITNLNLSCKELSQANVDELAQRLIANSTLTCLTLRHTGLSKHQVDQIALALCHHSTLKTLHVSGDLSAIQVAISPFSWSYQEPIAKMIRVNSTLSSLDLSDSSLSDTLLESIASALKTNSTLTRLCLSKNTLGARDIQILANALQNNRGIQSLVLSKKHFFQANINGTTMDSITQMLALNTTLKELDLSSNELGRVPEAALSRFFSAIESNLSLESLSLAGNLLEDAPENAIQQLFLAVGRNRNIIILNLEGNHLTNEGLPLALALTTNTTLRHLNLSSNCLGEEGGLQVAEALEVNRTLEKLDVTNTGVNDAVAKRFAGMLKVNATLRSLYLNDGWRDVINNTDAALGEIVQALANNTSLECLSLQRIMHDAAFQQEALSQIVAGLTINTTLHTLYYHGKPIRWDDKVALAQGLRSNSTLLSFHNRDIATSPLLELTARNRHNAEQRSLSFQMRISRHIAQNVLFDAYPEDFKIEILRPYNPTNIRWPQLLTCIRCTGLNLQGEFENYLRRNRVPIWLVVNLSQELFA